MLLEEFENRFRSENASNVSNHTMLEEFKMQQSLVILDSFLRKTQPGKSYDYCDAIFFENLCFKMFPAHNKLKSRRFQIPPV